MTDIRIHHIEARSYVDGPGERAVLFVQGCNLACPGCQSKHTWDLQGGTLADVRDVAQALLLLSRWGQITLSGGEIMLQPQAIAELIALLRAKSIRHIIAYTGFTWDQLHDPAHPAYPYLDRILCGLDVLVDGPFVRELDDDLICFRGSRNQRVIDIPASLQTGEPVLLDWDRTFQLSDLGDLILPIGLADTFNGLGATTKSRRCGQSR